MQEKLTDNTGEDSPPFTIIEPERYFYGESKFWHQNRASEWVSKPVKAFKNHLIGKGVSDNIPNGDTLSVADRMLDDIMSENTLDYIGRLAGYPAGFQEVGDLRCLITKTPKLIDPKEGDWPLIQEIILNMFTHPDDQCEEKQFEYFFQWLKHTLHCLYDYKIAKGLCLVVAGEKNSGKSLLQDIIAEMFGGGRASPYKYFTGQDKFNAQLAACVLHIMDDEAPPTGKAREQFADNAKQFVSASTIPFRAMQREAVDLKTLRRTMICTNCNSKAKFALPMVDEDSRDKYLMLRAWPQKMPRPSETPQEIETFFNEIKQELPAFIHYLLHEFQGGDIERGRFGCRAFIHPDINEILFDTSQELDTWLNIQKWMDYRDIDILEEKKATEINEMMTNPDTGVAPSQTKFVPQRHTLGERLMAIYRQKQFPDHLHVHGPASNNKRYTIKRVNPSKAEADPQEEF